jgi:NAD(P)-dependent dehydrogenase (short-subunit alcohol dehydrogenase family)
MTSTHKVAVIAGASQGIGPGLVRGFPDRGRRVVANSRSTEPVASADLLAIADPAVADRVIGSAVEKFGRVDTLVNNAGIVYPPRPDRHHEAAARPRDLAGGAEGPAMTTEPDRKTAGCRVTLEIDVLIGDVTWQFSTNADGQGVSLSPVVAGRSIHRPRRVDGRPTIQ